MAAEPNTAGDIGSADDRLISFEGEPMVRLVISVATADVLLSAVGPLSEGTGEPARRAAAPGRSQGYS